jgi:TonB-dependent SusC/RagA subfamily outer membrane receptor
MIREEKTQPGYKIKWLLLSLVAAVILLPLNAVQAIATNVDFAVIDETVEPEQIADTAVKSPKQASCTTENASQKPEPVIVIRIDSATVVQAFSDDCMRSFVKHYSSKCLIIIDGKESDETVLLNLTSKAIHSFNIYKKDTVTIKQYGDKGKNGVIVVVTKGNENISESAQPLIIIDGKESDETELLKQASNSIHYLCVYKDNNTVKLYGEKGRDRVFVVITDDNKTETEQKLNAVSVIEPQTLIIIDRKESNETELSKLKPNEIDSFSVMKDNAAIKKYGDKGKNGVIIVTTKGS